MLGRINPERVWQGFLLLAKFQKRLSLKGEKKMVSLKNVPWRSPMDPLSKDEPLYVMAETLRALVLIGDAERNGIDPQLLGFPQPEDLLAAMVVSAARAADVSALDLEGAINRYLQRKANPLPTKNG